MMPMMTKIYILRNVHNKASKKILEFIDFNTTTKFRNDAWSQMAYDMMKQLSFQILDQTEDEILSKSD